ncbi:MAG: LPXTG cell wall anchor domain-containing protein [Limisphaerales bacterium]
MVSLDSWILLIGIAMLLGAAVFVFSRHK